MPAPTAKTEQPKAPADRSASSQSGPRVSISAEFADNRPVAAAQRAQQAMITASPRQQQAAQLQAQIAQSPRQRAAQLRATGGPATATAIPTQLAAAPAPVQKKENKTGLPDTLKAGVEHLSGYSLDDVQVHYNSAKPAQLQAHAYAQGTDIHVAPGQEKHLPHEAWHVVQQKQGRVKPTMQLKGKLNVNDDAGLENDADMMGVKALRMAESSKSLVDNYTNTTKNSQSKSSVSQHQPIQRVRAINDVLNAIDQNVEELGTVSGSQSRRIMYWNSTGLFDVATGGNLSAKTLKKAMNKKIPIENADVNEGDLPEFMQARSDFSVSLPAYFGGGKLWFRKRPENVVFEGRGWISDNIYWRSAGVAAAPNVAAIPKVRYMIHAILEWAGQIGAAEQATPHITLRNAETQVKIDLDISNPLPAGASRILAPLEVTRASFAQGLGVNRTAGISMINDTPSFTNLKAATTQAWLTDLRAGAQAALNQ